MSLTPAVLRNATSSEHTPRFEQLPDRGIDCLNILSRTFANHSRQSAGTVRVDLYTQTLLGA